MYIQKRDGRKVKLDKMKIVDAVLAAFKEVDGEESEFALIKAGNIADYVQEYAETADHILDVEEVQDLVERGLMSTKRKDVAKAYILYREERSKIRNFNTAHMKEIMEKLTASNVQNSNANMDEKSFGGRKGEAANSLLKQIALDYIVSPKTRKNHINNEIYIHDLDSYATGMHNCLSIPFDKLLANGFNTRQVDIRPANSINTAFQLVAVIFQIQSLQQFGGCSATHLDWTMVPYIRKSFCKHYSDGLKYFGNSEIKNEIGINYIIDDYGKSDIPFYKMIDATKYKITDQNVYHNTQAYNYAMDMTKKELNQAAEGLFHNLNSLQSRSGNQLPFTSVNFGTCTLPEGQMVIEALLNSSIKGVGKHHKTPIFPCSIFQYMKGVNDKPGTPNYYLYRFALESTSKRLYPNYANVDWSGNTRYDINDPCTYFSTMGCRTANGLDINGMGQTKDGRGNIAPTTIILPTLAMETSGEISNKNIEEFMKLLDQKINEAKDSLIERFEYIASQDPASAKFMYENETMAGYIPEEGIRSALKHGTLAIGQLALAETLEILIGTDHTTLEGMELAKKIEQLFKDKCAKFKNDYKLNFGVYYTPAEGLCRTAMVKFKKKYGEIPKVSDKDYFTNSIHIPVYKEISPFDKIDLESKLTGYSSAGCITYVELDGGMEKNLDALEEIVNYAMGKDIPYFAINIPNDTCDDCGFTGEFDETCPECGGHNIQHLRRVTGYLTGDYKTAFNAGKVAETEDRIRHSAIKEV